MYYTEKRIDIRPLALVSTPENEFALRCLMHHGRVIKVPAGESLHHGARWRFIKLAQLQRAEPENQLIIFTRRD
jgi:hypothetical protein